MKVKLLIRYKGPKTAAAAFESEWLAEEDAGGIIRDLEKTGRLAGAAIQDELGQEWTLKEYEKLKKKAAEKPADPVIYFDGSFDKATGDAGLGIVLYYRLGQDDYRMRANLRIEAMESNNEAEYAALYNALAAAEEIGIRHVPCLIRGDAQGVLKQLAGEWPCYEQNLNAWLDRIEAKIRKLGIKPSFEPVGRNLNKEADKLASQALAGTDILSTVRLDGE